MFLVSMTRKLKDIFSTILLPFYIIQSFPLVKLIPLKSIFSINKKSKGKLTQWWKKISSFVRQVFIDLCFDEIFFWYWERIAPLPRHFQHLILRNQNLASNYLDEKQNKACSASAEADFLLFHVSIRPFWTLLADAQWEMNDDFVSIKNFQILALRMKIEKNIRANFTLISAVEISIKKLFQWIILSWNIWNRPIENHQQIADAPLRGTLRTNLERSACSVL